MKSCPRKLANFFFSKKFADFRINHRSRPSFPILLSFIPIYPTKLLSFSLVYLGNQQTFAGKEPSSQPDLERDSSIQTQELTTVKTSSLNVFFKREKKSAEKKKTEAYLIFLINPRDRRFRRLFPDRFWINDKYKKLLLIIVLP